jgi:mycothiol synthase
VQGSPSSGWMPRGEQWREVGSSVERAERRETPPGEADSDERPGVTTSVDAMGSNVRVRSTGRLAAADLTAVRGLVDTAAADDGFSALNEAGLLHLQHQREGVQHVLAEEESGGKLLGYGQVEAGTASSTGLLVVAPHARRRGVGTALFAALLAATPSRLQVWAVGDTAAAQALASRAGLVRSRELWVMTRPLTEPLPEPQVAEGVRLRTFVPGQDEEAWLAVNARAFASHPEQGSLTADDLAQRMAEPWFDPAGFFLAEAGSDLLGFHWTKQHPDHLGEVYVLGVDPGSGGRGLGKTLLDAGLAHLRARGNTMVELYVEGDHVRAVALYRGRGFTRASRDVMYAQP